MSTSGQVRIAADLRFSVELPGHEPVCGTVTGSGNRLEVRLSDPAYFAGGRDASHLRSFAAGLAEHGITVIVMAGDVVLLEVGVTQTPWWQRPLTRSRHLKVGSARGAWTGAIGRLRGSAANAVLPGRELLPPTTMFPIAPTFGSGPRPATTTNDPHRGGNPRLALAAGSRLLPDDGRVLFPLRGDVSSIGSATDSDVRLDGLAPIQAVIVRDERDELVLFDHVGDGVTRLNGECIPEEGRVLRTGARVEVGGWIFVYRRAEYADHGRPYGGRVGGELGHQKSQPPMPSGAPGRPGRAAR